MKYHLTCAEREEERSKEQIEDEEEQKRQIKKIKLFKHVGKSVRSDYERGLEHQKDPDEPYAQALLLQP